MRGVKGVRGWDVKEEGFYFFYIGGRRILGCEEVGRERLVLWLFMIEISSSSSWSSCICYRVFTIYICIMSGPFKFCITVSNTSINNQ